MASYLRKRPSGKRKKSLADIARDWWVMGLRGLAAVVAGVIILFTPYPHTEDLLRVFGAYMLTDGVIVLLLMALEVRHSKGWTKSALNGVLGIVFGLLNLIGNGPVRLRADLIGLRTFLAGLSSIIMSRQLEVAPAEFLLGWLLTMAGIGSVIFSLMISVGPLLIGHLLDEFGWMASLYTLGYGALYFIICIWLLKLNRRATPAATA